MAQLHPCPSACLQICRVQGCCLPLLPPLLLLAAALGPAAIGLLAHPRLFPWRRADRQRRRREQANDAAIVGSADVIALRGPAAEEVKGH